MTTKEIATKLVNYCRNGDFDRCYEELYSQDCISLEPNGAMNEIAKGMVEIAKKGETWSSIIKEIHGAEVGNPIIAGNHFSCRMWNDITYTDGNRMQTEELCLYEIQNGKIVKEQFFYEIYPKG